MLRRYAGFLALTAHFAAEQDYSISPEEVIVGGERAAAGEAPWYVRVVIPGSSCGGTWIGPTTVLTAAHCFDVSGTDSHTTQVRLYTNDDNHY